jgi:hypothetical protein
MPIPTASAASMMRVPRGTETDVPLTLHVTIGTGGAALAPVLVSFAIRPFVKPRRLHVPVLCPA